MSNEGFWIINSEGEQELLPYDEIDPDVLPGFFKPIGGFCFAAGDYLHMPLSAAPFYVKDWLPKQGKMELYAPPKAGKSFLMVQLARCLGVGEPFLGLPTERSRVLYLQFEMGEEVLQSRMKSTGQSYDNVFVGTTFGMRLDQSEGKKQLEAALDAIRPDVLILDLLSKIMTGDENESTDMKVITSYFDEIIEGYGCSIVVVHHAGKDISKGGRGSNLLEGWVDSYIEMKKVSKPGEPLRAKIMPKSMRHSACPPEATEVVLVDGEFVVVTEGEKVESIKAKIERMFLAGGNSTWNVRDIMAATEAKNRGTINKHLSALVAEGKIVKIGRGEYAFQSQPMPDEIESEAE